MTLRAPSEEGSGSVAKAADGKTGTIWHTNWGKGSGSTDLRNDPDNRYLQSELKETEKIPLKSIKRRWHNEPVNVDCEIEDLILTSMNQNFVPVIDDKKIFIGIIRRKDIIAYCYDRCKKAEKQSGDSVTL